MKNITCRRTIWLLLTTIVCLGVESNLAQTQAVLPNLNPNGIEIVGGQDAPDPNPYTWQVSIGYRGISNDDDNNEGHFCGGSVTQRTCGSSSDGVCGVHPIVASKSTSIALSSTQIIMEIHSGMILP